MLLRRLKPHTVRWGKRIRQARETPPSRDGAPGAVEVVFEDGERLSCGLLVGADGIHSHVRLLKRGWCIPPVAAAENGVEQEAPASTPAPASASTSAAAVQGGPRGGVRSGAPAAGMNEGGDMRSSAANAANGIGDDETRSTAAATTAAATGTTAAAAAAADAYADPGGGAEAEAADNRAGAAMECTDGGGGDGGGSGEAAAAATAAAAAALRRSVRQRSNGLRYLGVVAVVGISSLRHPLLERRGFYTVDGEHRLFVMPFEEGAQPLTMWQFTFRYPLHAMAIEMCRWSRAVLMEEVHRRIAGWHEPVRAMMDATQHADIWAAPLCDRDNPPPPRKGTKSRITLVGGGPTIHPMSAREIPA